MEQIEQATGKQIIRIETNDLDAMEEVRAVVSREHLNHEICCLRRVPRR